MQVLLEDASIRNLLESVLDIACDKWHPCRESLTKIDNAIRLVSVFTERIPKLPKLPKAVLQSISNEMVSDIQRQYALQVQEAIRLGLAPGHSAIDVCPLSYREAREQLHHSFSNMVLRSALYAPQSASHLNVFALTLLLEQQLIHHPTQSPSVQCTQRRPMKVTTPNISMFEALSTPGMASVSVNWRDGLLREMSRDATCRYEGVVRIVGQVCRDLELRCNEIERPLRDEQAKSRDLQARLESSEQKKSELANQARELQSSSDSLETERDLLANQAEASENRSKELEASLDKIRREFEYVETEAERAARAACESARQQDLVYLAAITGKDEAIEEQSLKISRIENGAKALDHELTRMRELEAVNTKKLNGNIETLKIAISTSECRIKDLQIELTRTQEQNAGHAVNIKDNETLIEELKGNIVALNNSSDQCESLISTLKTRLQEAENRTSEMRLQHDKYVSAKDAEFERSTKAYQSLVDKKQNELEVTHKSATVAREEFEKTIAALHIKIGELRRERKVSTPPSFLLRGHTAFF